MGILTLLASMASAGEPNAPAGLEGLLRPIRARRGVPALAAAMVRGGRLAGIGAVGVRKAGCDVPVTREDLFHIGSCTKAMTATLIARLVERGRLAWDTTLAGGLPREVAGAMHPGYREATLTHLLRHRAAVVANAPPGVSFGRYFRLRGSGRRQRLTYARGILAVPPKAPPGETYSYSNAGYALAAALAEHAADAGWQELIRREVFAPLKMTALGFGAMGTAGRIDQPYQHAVGEDGRAKPVGPGRLSDNPPILSPAGRVHCSLADWARFAAAHVAGARGRATPLGLSPASWKRLHTPPAGGHYAMGWVVADRDWAGGAALMHNGSNTMNYAVAWLAPRRDFAVLAVTNQGGEAARKACDEAASTVILAHLPPSPRRSD